MITADTLRIDARTFFQRLPVFADSANEEYNFAMFAPFIEDATARALYYTNPATDLDSGQEAKIAVVAQHYIIALAAHRAIPQLDLIYTPNGFGIVSNTNVAPASRERVDALLHNVEEQRDSSLCYLVEALKDASPAWCASIVATSMYGSLIPLPVTAAASGITCEDTKRPPTTFAELARLGGAINVAQATLGDLVSEKLVAKLLKFQCEPMSVREQSPVYEVLLNRCRSFIASYLYSSNPKTVRRVADNIIRYAEENGVPEYFSSSLYQATHGGHYENRKEDKCFFFN